MAMAWTQRVRPWHVVVLAGIVRAALVAFAEYQDKYLSVKYTDIDYVVFTDAARFVAAGGSPYQRSTYRYSPLLAYLLLPNIWLHPLWGKVLFSLGDLAAAGLISYLLERTGASAPSRTVALAAWLFNPYTATISTRGSCDVLSVLLLLLLLVSLMYGSAVLSGVLYGLAVHFRIYPVIYGPAVVLFLMRRRDRQLLQQQQHSDGERGRMGSPGVKGPGEGSGAGEQLLAQDVANGDGAAGASGGDGGGSAGSGGLLRRRHVGSTPTGAAVGSPGGSSNAFGSPLAEPEGPQSADLGNAFPPEHGNDTACVRGKGREGAPRRSQAAASASCGVMQLVRRTVRASPPAAAFSAASAATFLLLGLLFFRLYGNEFVHETFVHHLTRKDPRHNFSPYYYPIYLSYATSQESSPRHDARAPRGRTSGQAGREAYSGEAEARVGPDESMAADKVPAAAAAAAAAAATDSPPQSAGTSGMGAEGQDRGAQQQSTAADAAAEGNEELLAAAADQPGPVGGAAAEPSTGEGEPQDGHRGHTVADGDGGGDGEHRAWDADLALVRAAVGRMRSRAVGAVEAAGRAAAGLWREPWRLAFLPQAAVLLAVALRYHTDLPACWLLQTWAFVTFNKVVTAQYFVWYLSLLPLVLPRILQATRTTQATAPASPSSSAAAAAAEAQAAGAAAAVACTAGRARRGGAALSEGACGVRRWMLVAAAGLWVGAQLHWLAWAYQLEMKGRAVHLGLWAAGLVFMCANTLLLGLLMRVLLPGTGARTGRSCGLGGSQRTLPEQEAEAEGERVQLTFLDVSLGWHAGNHRGMWRGVSAGGSTKEE